MLDDQGNVKSLHKVLCDCLLPLSRMIQPANPKYPGTIVKGEDPRRHKVIVSAPLCQSVSPTTWLLKSLAYTFRVFDSRKDLI